MHAEVEPEAIKMAYELHGIEATVFCPDMVYISHVTSAWLPGAMNYMVSVRERAWRESHQYQVEDRSQKS